MTLSPILVLATLAGLAAPAAAEVVLINAFDIPQDQQDATVAAWQAARDVPARQPGYIDTTLHRAITPDARFALVNVARWESPEAFAAATRVLQATGAFAPPPGVVATPALYTVIRTDAPQAPGCVP
jgi:heme-degrading monooxygenase HmoA